MHFKCKHLPSKFEIHLWQARRLIITWSMRTWVFIGKPWSLQELPASLLLHCLHYILQSSIGTLCIKRWKFVPTSKSFWRSKSQASYYTGCRSQSGWRCQRRDHGWIEDLKAADLERHVQKNFHWASDDRNCICLRSHGLAYPGRRFKTVLKSL